jgi:hypothetical protein
VVPSKPAVRIHWRTTPPTTAQLAAWDWLLTRLLEKGLAIETPKPQESPPGASTIAAVASDSHHWSGYYDDSTRCTPST